MARQWGKYYSKSSKNTVEKLEATNQGYRDRINAAGLPGAEAPKPKRTVLETLGDWLSRADYALGNVLHRSAQDYKRYVGESGKLGGTAKYLWSVMTHGVLGRGDTGKDSALQRLSTLGKDVVEGFTGKQKTELKHAMEDYGFSTTPFRERKDIVGKTIGKVPVLRNWSPAGSAGLGVSFINPLDPLNYIGVGQATDLGKAALKEGAKQAPKWGLKVGGKVVRELPGLQKQLLRGGKYVREGMPLVSGFIQKVGPLLSSTFRKAGTRPDQWASYLDIERGLIEGLNSVRGETLDFYKGLVKKYPKETLTVITDALEKPDIYAKLPASSRLLVSQLGGRSDALGKELMKAGVMDELLENYVAHVRGREYEKGLRTLQQLIIKDGGQPTGALRSLMGVGPRIVDDTVNAAMRDPNAALRFIKGPISTINKTLGAEFFEPNYAVAAATRELRGRNALLINDFINEIVRRFGKPITAETLLTPDTGVFASKVGGALTNYTMPRQIADRLNSWIRTATTDETLREVGGLWNKATNLWKGYATAANLGFHLRNTSGNIYNLWEGDSFTIRDFISGIKAQLGKKGTIRLPSGELWSMDDVRKWARKTGADRGFFAADNPESIRRVLEGASPKKINLKTIAGAINPVSQDNVLLRGGRAFGDMVEGSARMAGFINQLRKTGNPYSAAKTVDKYLFNYGDLTPAMRSLRNTAVPFLAWQKGNIPLQLSQMVENPAKLNRTLKVLRAVSQENQPKDNGQYLPKYIRELNGVPLGLQDTSGNPLYLNPNLPFQDLNKLDPMAFLAQGLNPLIKVPLELYQNRSWFFNTPIEKFPGEQTKFLGIPMRKKAAYVGQSIPFFSSLDKLITKTKAGNPGNQPGLSPAQLHALSWLGSIKLMPYDAAKERTSQAYRERDRLQALVRALSDQGKLPEKVATPKGRRWGKHFKS